MRRTGFGLLFFTWLYGVPFLLIVGLIRRSWDGPVNTRAEAERFGALTDLLLTWGLALNALPIAGLLAAAMVDRGWLRVFAAAGAGMVVIYAAVAALSATAYAPLIGDRPAHLESATRITRCIPTSGGMGCPGG